MTRAMMMTSLRSLFAATSTVLAALLASPVAAAQAFTEDEAELEAAEELEASESALVTAGIWRFGETRAPRVVLGLKTAFPGRDPELVGLFLFRRSQSDSALRRRPTPPLRIAPARRHGVWVLVAEGRF
jgi:hypothetical protein